MTINDKKKITSTYYLASVCAYFPTETTRTTKQAGVKPATPQLSIWLSPVIDGNAIRMYMQWCDGQDRITYKMPGIVSSHPRISGDRKYHEQTHIGHQDLRVILSEEEYCTDEPSPPPTNELSDACTAYGNPLRPWGHFRPYSKDRYKECRHATP